MCRRKAIVNVLELLSCRQRTCTFPLLSGTRSYSEGTRQSTAELHVPVIFITGHGDIRTSVHAMKSGVQEFLTKPLDGDAPLAAIESVLRGSARRGLQREDQVSA